MCHQECLHIFPWRRKRRWRGGGGRGEGGRELLLLSDSLALSAKVEDASLPPTPPDQLQEVAKNIYITKQEVEIKTKARAAPGPLK